MVENGRGRQRRSATTLSLGLFCEHSTSLHMNAPTLYDGVGPRPADTGADAEGTRGAALAQGQMGSAQSGKRPPASASVGSGASKRQRQVQTAPMESSDELIAAAPRLAAAMRSAVKCVKVADKVSSMLEGGLVKLSNASAVFDVLSVAAEEPARWRTPSMRASFRRLFSAADGRLACSRCLSNSRSSYGGCALAG